MVGFLLTVLVSAVQVGTGSEVSPAVSPSGTDAAQTNAAVDSTIPGVSAEGKIFVLSDGSVVAKWDDGYSSTDESSPPAHFIILPGDEKFTLIKEGSEWRLERSDALRTAPDEVPSSALRIPLVSKEGDTLRSVLEMKGTLTLSESDGGGVRTLWLDESNGAGGFSISLTLDMGDLATRTDSSTGPCCTATCSGIIQTSCSCYTKPCSCFCGLFGASCSCGGQVALLVGG